MTYWEEYRNEWKHTLVDEWGLPPDKFEQLFKQGKEYLEFAYDACLHAERGLRIIKVNDLLSTWTNKKSKSRSKRSLQ